MASTSASSAGAGAYAVIAGKVTLATHEPASVGATAPEAWAGSRLMSKFADCAVAGLYLNVLFVAWRAGSPSMKRATPGFGAERSILMVIELMVLSFQTWSLATKRTAVTPSAVMALVVVPGVQGSPSML